MADGMQCSLPPYSFCAYRDCQNSWTVYRCGCDGTGRWNRWGQTEGCPGPSNCPLNPPTEGTACSIDGHGDCAFFPDINCACATLGPLANLWACHGARDVPGECVDGPLHYPRGIDDSVVVAEMTTEQRAQWCLWYTQSGGT